jgi:hypothetical protein
LKNRQKNPREVIAMKMLEMLVNGHPLPTTLMFDALATSLPMRFVAKLVGRDTGEAELYVLSYLMRDVREFEAQLQRADPVFNVEDTVTVKFDTTGGECRFAVDVGDRPLPGTPMAMKGLTTFILDWIGRSSGRGMLTCITTRGEVVPSAVCGQFFGMDPLKSGDKFSVRVRPWLAEL